jgi:hypothetical protein
MANPSLPMNGKKLAARWNIETIDLLYIMMSHGLNVVDQYGDKVAIEDVLEDFKKNKDAAEYLFNLSEVKEIENKLKVDGEIPHVEAIRGKDLMARWDMHEAEIHSIMFTQGWDVIDPFGNELDSNRIYPLINDNTLDVSDFLFGLSDVEEFESEHPEIVSDRIQDKKTEKKLRSNQIHKIKCREVAQKLWEEDPSITIADMIHKDNINEVFDGKVYAEKTIRNWIKDLCPNRSPGRRPKKK